MIKTIGGKVTLWSIVIVGILNIILSIFIYIIINEKLETTIIAHMKTVQLMAKNITLTKSSLNEDDNYIVNNLYDIFGDYILIADKESKILSSRGNILNEDKVRSILRESKNRKSLLNLSKYKETYITTFNYPIYINETYYGNILVQKDYTEEYKESYKIISSIFIGQAVILIILVISLWIIINKFTKPINELSNAMENFVIDKDETDIKINSKDEVAILADKFNFMKNEIKDQMGVIIKEQNKNREFFNNATHELKTPITAINGYTEILLNENILEMDEEFRNRALERMNKESKKLNSLVKNILEVSRGEAINTLVKERFDLGEFIEKKVNDMNIRFEKSNIEIKSKINNIKIIGNKEEINTIIINFLDNAIKYNAGNEIKINVYENEKYGVFEISNEIYDIPENLKYSLLEPFVKYTDDIILEKEGITSSGLGLYICNKLAEENNSKIKYSIEENIIEFKLIIPKNN